MAAGRGTAAGCGETNEETKNGLGEGDGGKTGMIGDKCIREERT